MTDIMIIGLMLLALFLALRHIVKAKAGRGRCSGCSFRGSCAEKCDGLSIDKSEK